MNAGHASWRFPCGAESCDVDVSFRRGEAGEPGEGRPAWRHVDDGSIVRTRKVACRSCSGSGFSAVGLFGPSERCRACAGTGELEVDDHVASPDRGRRP